MIFTELMGAKNKEQQIERSPFTVDDFRKVLKRRFHPIHTITVKSNWKSHHAEFYLLQVKSDKKEPAEILVKRFVKPGDDELVYSLAHNPDSLYTREKNNLNVVGNFISGTLVPEIYGCLDLPRGIVMEHFSRGSLSSRLTTVANEITSTSNSAATRMSKRKLLLEGTKNLARFVGLCNAKEASINKLYDYKTEYEQERSRMESLREELLRRYLAKIYFHNTPECIGKEQPYQYLKVKEVLKSKGIDLDERVTQICSLRLGLNEKPWLQHGDYNVAHAYGKKVIDLEDFGYYPWTRDLSTFFMGGIDNISLPDSAELPGYINLFLAYKQANEIRYSKSKEESEKSIAQLDALLNGVLPEASSKDFLQAISQINVDFLTQNKAIESKTGYAEFLFSFFASAIEEGVHLDATLKRYDEEHLQMLINGLNGYTSEEMRRCKSKYVNELFGAVELCSPFMRDCANPEKVKDYFITLGKLLKEVDVIEYDSSRIDRPSITDSVYSAMSTTPNSTVEPKDPPKKV